MVVGGRPQHPVARAAAQEVRDQEDDGAALLHAVEILERAGDVRTALGILGGREHLARQTHHRVASLARRDVLHNPIGEEDEPDLVLVADRRQRQERRHFRGQVGLGASAATVALGARDVHHEENRQLSLFAVPLDVRDARAGGDVPVDGTDIIADGVRTHLVKLDALALERRMIIATQLVVDQLVGEDSDLPHLGHQLFDVNRHYGTGTSFKILSMRPSAVMPSASAS